MAQISLQEYLKWESSQWISVTKDLTTDEKVYFMPIKHVEAYFTASDSRRLNKILMEVFKTEYPPVDSELILREHTAIFCILLRMGQGRQIEHFVRYEELSDRRLPFDESHPPREFPTVGSEPDFLHRFIDKQRMYCVPVLDSHMLHKHFGNQRLLPITSHELYGNQSVASQYVVTIYGPHNKLMPPVSDTQHPHNTFVLKSYPKDAEAQYKQEVDGFRGVRHAESIIKFYGSFIHGDDFNVLLEYADKGSLEDYFQKETPPSRGIDIIKFWEGLFLLIKGLKAIHSVRLAHHDVKPENVVVVSNGNESPSQWNFKFANVGVSHTKGSTPMRILLPSGKESSSTYGPPESYAPNHDNRAEKRSSKVTWSADIWSLGCTYSEAAMWIADGYKGLLDYRRQRVMETDRILFKGGNCFHDGEKVLQCVLEAHADIEDRLRRSDYITKDVLDSMVDEMLWDEDRPNAKALWRKAEMVLSRARQRLSVNSGDEFSRSSSGQSRVMSGLSLPTRSAAPTVPLPPIPPLRTAQPGLSSIQERQYPPNVERWRSQVGQLNISATSQISASGSEFASPKFPSQQTTLSTESMSELDRDIASSVASWNFGDNASSGTSPTQFGLPLPSMQYNMNRHNSNEGRQRSLRGQPNYEYRLLPRKALSHLSYTNTLGPSDSASVVAPHPSEHPAYSQNRMSPPSLNQSNYSYQERSQPPLLNQDNYSHQERAEPLPSIQDNYSPQERTQSPPINHVTYDQERTESPSPFAQNAWSTENSMLQLPKPAQGGWTKSLVLSEQSEMPTQSKDELRVLSRRSSQTNSHVSSTSSHPSEQPPPRPKSSKRNGGLSLFPSKNWNAGSAVTQIRRSIEKVSSSQHSSEDANANVPRSMVVRSSTSGSLPSLPGGYDDHASRFTYLSLNTAYEWKMAQKKTKKSSKVPPLPGAHMLTDLNNRDHIFIIDDSASMTSCWADVKRVFETLSYLVKGMSPDGTELFFTVAYDTWRRKDTYDLVTYLEKKRCVGVTDISKRLDIQLQTYRHRLYVSRKPIIPLKKGRLPEVVRPMSFYVLTNGEWGPGADVKEKIQTTVDFLRAEGYPEGQVTIEFISFARSAGAMQKINELSKHDFKMDIADCTRWTGNVLKMLKGAMDKSLFDTESQTDAGLPIQMTPLEGGSVDTRVYARDVINELA